ncbi:MAG: N,N'-diacetyllegionaminic acid synthase [Chlamydiae bacterium]|nr:N,N'-diacetyllegionaminic acid synthase [Chlamydiota bacterium]
MTIPPIILHTGRTIGKGFPAYIVAEIGSNHDGELDRAKKLIREAKEAGADAAKFQSFQVQNLINRKLLISQQWQPDPSWEMLEKLSIPEEWHHELQQEAKNVGIDFLSTPFDLERLKLIVDLKVPAIKIASGDLTYHELVRAAGRSGLPVFLSTGHASLGEVEATLRVLWEAGCKDIVLLHCASIYPADFEDANIPAMVSMQQGFQVQVGYSDHTPGNIVPLGAVTLGGCVIEKHITDDKSRPGPDHAFALDFEEFSQMVRQVRQLEEAMIGGKKYPRPSEIEERIMARRALYAKTDIPRESTLNRENVNIVRHAYPEGIPANCWNRVEGRAVVRNVAKDELITWEMI